MKYRKKPVVIEAFQLPAEDVEPSEELMDWLGQAPVGMMESDYDGSLLIHTLEGVMRADPGDWIIKGVEGEYYPCKPDIFKATYEPADQPTSTKE